MNASMRPAILWQKETLVFRKADYSVIGLLGLRKKCHKTSGLIKIFST